MKEDEGSNNNVSKNGSAGTARMWTGTLVILAAKARRIM